MHTLPRYHLEVSYPDAAPVVVRDAYSFAPVARRARPAPDRRGAARAALDRARRASPHDRRGCRDGVLRVGAGCTSGQRRRRLQRLERARSPDAIAGRRRRLGAVRARGRRRPRLQVRDPRRGRRGPPQGRPAARCARSCRPRPDRWSSSRVTRWTDEAWLERRRDAEPHAGPISIYEVHLGSWRLNTLEGNRSLTYAELADELADYVLELGFTHVELMPVMEHPFTGSWGYQVTGYFAPTARYGTPDEFRSFVDRLHAARPRRDPRLGACPLPARRVRARALRRHGAVRARGPAPRRAPRLGHARLQLRPHRGAQLPRRQRALLALAVPRRRRARRRSRLDALPATTRARRGSGCRTRTAAARTSRRSRSSSSSTSVVHGREPGVDHGGRGVDSLAGVSRPTYLGGLGFGFKWNMGWMHDTLAYFRHDPAHRSYHHGELTFSLMYAFSENFILPLSHDEVVHGKGSLLDKMPGDRWQQLANLRALYGYMWAHPGKKLLFMGGELAQEREWSHDRSLDWHLLEHARASRRADAGRRPQPGLPRRAGAVGDRRRSRRVRVARAQRRAANVIAFARFSTRRRAHARLRLQLLARAAPGLPGRTAAAGSLGARCSTPTRPPTAARASAAAAVDAEELAWHGQQWSAELTLPPLGVIWLVPEGR